MKINVRVRTQSKKQEVIEESDFYRVKLLSAPERGKANRELIKVLAEYFKVSKSQIKIIQGFKRPDKVVEIRN